MITTKVKTKTIVTAGIAIAGVALVSAGALFFTRSVQANNRNFIRIVDGETASVTSTQSPGADIKGVEIVKAKSEKSSFAEEVIFADIKDGQNGSENKFKDASNIMGNPTDDPAKYVSLGGGEIIVRVGGSGVDTNDKIIIHEIGGINAAHADSFDVYISNSSEGPWEMIGTGSGPTTLTIQ